MISPLGSRGTVALAAGIVVSLLPWLGVGAATGCDGSLPVKRGESFETTFTSADGRKRKFQVFFPRDYDGFKPYPVVLSLHGWGGTSLEDSCDSGLTAVANATGDFIVAHLQGMQDYPKGNPENWGAWHFNGSTSNGGVSCDTSQAHDEYCYTSNLNCTACDWTDGVDDVAFVAGLLDAFEEDYCVDEAREYVTGMSNGAMMTYQLGASLSRRLAAIAPVAGSFAWNHLVVPEVALPVLDVHGTRDTTVPGNSSGSGQHGRVSDGCWWYYDTDSVLSAWISAAQGAPSSLSWEHYPTSWDGRDGLWCVSAGSGAAEVVKCSWDGGHQYYGGNGSHYIYDCVPESLSDTYSSNGFLVWEFLSKHSLSNQTAGGSASQ